MLRSPDREVVPEILSEGDLCAQDEAIFEAGSFENCVRYGSPCSDEASWKEQELRFHDAYLGVLAGLRPWDDADLLDSAVQLGLDGPRHHDARPPRTADRVLDDEVLCDAVEDSVPELMMLIERISGVAGMPRRPVVGMVAALAYVYCGIEGTRPLDGWMDDEDERSLCQAARVIDDAPVGIWWNGECLLPIVPRWRPPAAAFAGLPALFAARAYPVKSGGQAGWAFSGMVALKLSDPEADAVRLGAAVERRMMLELWRLRRHERRSTFEDVLRKRPEVVYRSAGELCAYGDEQRASVPARID